MKNTFYVVMLLFISNSFSQSIFLKSGLNMTSYDYKDSKGNTNENIKPSSGVFYEIGYTMSIKTGGRGKYRAYGPYSRLKASSSISINQYNATGGNLVDSYDWKTNYLGWNNFLNYSFTDQDDLINTGIKFGLGFSTLISGTQRIGGQSFDLMKNQEFNALWFYPMVGLEVKYDLYQDAFLSLGYDYSKLFSLTGKSKEKLSFNNSQIRFGITIFVN